MSDTDDLDANPRIWRGEDSLTVDMGAYEYGSYQLKVTEITIVGNIQLTWNSQEGENYSIFT